jgi:hypothetical protein
MKVILIKKVENGFIVDITYEGHQSIYEQEATYIANDKTELLKLVEENS